MTKAVEVKNEDVHSRRTEQVNLFQATQEIILGF